jgi:hypothetical protein
VGKRKVVGNLPEGTKRVSEATISIEVMSPNLILKVIQGLVERQSVRRPDTINVKETTLRFSRNELMCSFPRRYNKTIG